MNLKPDDFTFKTTLNGVDISLDAVSAQELMAKLDAFGDDCSDGCKYIRESIRAAIDKVERENKSI